MDAAGKEIAGLFDVAGHVLGSAAANIAEGAEGLINAGATGLGIAADVVGHEAGEAAACSGVAGVTEWSPREPRLPSLREHLQRLSNQRKLRPEHPRLPAPFKMPPRQEHRLQCRFGGCSE